MMKKENGNVYDFEENSKESIRKKISYWKEKLSEIEYFRKVFEKDIEKDMMNEVIFELIECLNEKEGKNFIFSKLKYKNKIIDKEEEIIRIKKFLANKIFSCDEFKEWSKTEKLVVVGLNSDEIHGSMNIAKKDLEIKENMFEKGKGKNKKFEDIDFKLNTNSISYLKELRKKIRDGESISKLYFNMNKQIIQDPKEKDLEFGDYRNCNLKYNMMILKDFFIQVNIYRFMLRIFSEKYRKEMLSTLIQEIEDIQIEIKNEIKIESKQDIYRYFFDYFYLISEIISDEVIKKIQEDLCENLLEDSCTKIEEVEMIDFFKKLETLKKLEVQKKINNKYENEDKNFTKKLEKIKKLIEILNTKLGRNISEKNMKNLRAAYYMVFKCEYSYKGSKDIVYLDEKKLKTLCFEMIDDYSKGIKGDTSIEVLCLISEKFTQETYKTEGMDMLEYKLNKKLEWLITSKYNEVQNIIGLENQMDYVEKLSDEINKIYRKLPKKYKLLEMSQVRNNGVNRK